MQILYKNFNLKVLDDRGKRVIDFANNTPNFVEVMLNIDGQVVRGYCYPPYHHKPIRTVRGGGSLPLSEHGQIQAFVFAGIGQYKKINNDELSVPPFIRFYLNQDKFRQEGSDMDSVLRQKLAQKVIFHRTSQTPIEIINISY
jgi:hypothetical protein